MCIRDRYKNGYVISDIEPIRGTVTFTNGIVIHQGEVIGDVVEQDMRRIHIRETIQSHFEKEEKLFEMGIKTLSLFFIDEVAKYRQYGEDGEELLGEYGRIFEEEYNAILNEYLTLFDTPYQRYLRSIEVADTHKGLSLIHIWSIMRTHRSSFTSLRCLTSSMSSLMTYPKIRSRTTVSYTHLDVYKRQSHP